MKTQWHYYLRDDALVFRANVSSVEFWSDVQGNWVKSMRYGNEVALIDSLKVEKISLAKANKLILP